MEAELVRELPAGDGWQYEPKWDGFRGVLENDGGELALWSRNERPLLRYFPELRPLGDLLPPHSALDGEIVIARDGVLDFDSMSTRLHPAESRVKKLSAEIPAIFIAFDLLLWDGDPVHERPLEERRAELLKRGKGFWISPATSKLDAATAWLDRFEAAGLDGVIAKRLGVPYMPGSREAVVKVKEHKTADCVVIGVRWKERPEKLATLLLGLYRDDGEVDYVGSAAIGARNHDEIAELVLPLLDESSERRFSEPNRWGTNGLEETPLRRELVAEVRYDKVQGNRFRHGTKLIRFRPDKDLRNARGVRCDPCGVRATLRSRRSSAPPPEHADRNDVGDAGDRAELGVRGAVAAMRPLPDAHADDQADRDVPGEHGRVDVESLPVLVPPVSAQAANQFTAAAEEYQEAERRHHSERLDSGSPFAAHPERAEEHEPQRDREQWQEPFRLMQRRHRIPPPLSS